VEAEVFNANGRTDEYDKANGRYFAISRTNPNKTGNVRTTITLRTARVTTAVVTGTRQYLLCVVLSYKQYKNIDCCKKKYFHGEFMSLATIQK
jgi:hypothetical protein